MTSWRYETSWLLLVFLSTIDLSKEECLDCVEDDRSSWQKNLKDVQLFTTMDSKDTLECTIQKMCLDKINCTCQILKCFERTDYNDTIKNEKCVKKNKTIDVHHFNCLLAKALDHYIKGCEYEFVCPLYRETKGQTTLATTSATVSTTSRKLAATSATVSTTLTTVSPPLPTTSTTVSTSRTSATTSTPLATTLIAVSPPLATTSTTVSTTSRKLGATSTPLATISTTVSTPLATTSTTVSTSRTSATTSTTVSTSTPLAKTLPEKKTATTTTTTTTTTHVTQSIQSISHASQKDPKKVEANPETWNLQALLITSAICNVVFPLLVYLYMQQQRRRDWSLQNALNGDLQVNQPAAELEFLTNGTCSPDIPMKNGSLEEGTL